MNRRAIVFDLDGTLLNTLDDRRRSRIVGSRNCWKFSRPVEIDVGQDFILSRQVENLSYDTIPNTALILTPARWPYPGWGNLRGPSELLHRWWPIQRRVEKWL